MLRVSLMRFKGSDPVGSTVGSPAAQRLLRLRTTPSAELHGAGAASQLSALRSFLARCSSDVTWVQALLAVQDSLRHGVRIGRGEYASLFACLAEARQPAVAARVAAELATRRLCSWNMQQTVVRQGLLAVCAASGDYNRARELVAGVLAASAPTRGNEPTATANTTAGSARPYCPLTSAELQLAMQAAVTALRRSGGLHHHRGRPRHDDSGQAVWASAMAMFVQCRMHPASRDSAVLTSALVHTASQLLEAGANWQGAVAVMTAAGRRNVVIQDETLDVVARCCFTAEKHLHVLRVVENCIATNTSPHEATVRLAIVSCDEASAYSPTAWRLGCQLLQALTENGLPLLPATYETVLRCCATSHGAGQWESALAVAAQMVGHGMAPPLYLLKLAVAKRIEFCATFAEAQRLAALPMFAPVHDKADPVMLLALLRCALRLEDWRAWRAVNRRFIEQELPVTHEKLLVQIEGAYVAREWTRVVVQFEKVGSRILRLFKPDSMPGVRGSGRPHHSSGSRVTDPTTTSSSSSSSSSSGGGKVFPVYPQDVFIPSRIWAMVDAAFAHVEKDAPQFEKLRDAKDMALRLERLRHMEAEGLLFGAGEAQLDDAQPSRLRIVAGEGDATGPEDPVWAYSAEERRAMHPAQE